MWGPITALDLGPCQLAFSAEAIAPTVLHLSFVAAQPQVLRLLKTLKIKHDFQLNNQGCIQIEPPATKDYMARWVIQ